MAQNLAKQMLQSRNEYLSHLKTDLEKNDSVINSVTSKLEELKLTSNNVQELGKKVEHEALIPLDKLAFPDSYSVLDTLENTIKHLERKIEHQNNLLKTSEINREQLKQRMELLRGCNESNNDDLPKEIASDRGVALKVGDYYEIVEFEA